jgi:hypothetical protein
MAVRDQQFPKGPGLKMGLGRDVAMNDDDR